jgi:hypothetical protein
MNSDSGTLHLFNYAFNSKLKSTNVLNSIQYIRVVSYYSHDAGQRNINEIEVFDTAGVNILYGDTTITHYIFTDNRILNWNGLTNTTYTNVADGLYDFGHRWESWRNGEDGSYNHEYVNAFTDTLNAKFDSVEKHLNIGIIDTATALFILDTIVNNTVYPDFDTVWFQVNLRKPVNIERIKLYLGEHRQVFDVWVSIDGVKWAILPKNEYTVINNPDK